MNRFGKFARHIFQRTDPAEYTRILDAHNPYFRDLNEVNKGKFIRRTDEFMHAVSFSTEGDLEINLNMKVIISSAFIQITFGLKEYILHDYDEIFIAPRSYTYPGYGKLLSGDVNTQLRRVSLAWPSVIKGFEIEDDALNIAIHEFGHCLTIENFSRPYIGHFFSEKDWKDWAGIAWKKVGNIRASKNAVIRKYGGTDIMELFAVSLENFFERPQYMKDRLPNMYSSLTRMLNQDPRDRSNPVIR